MKQQIQKFILFVINLLMIKLKLIKTDFFSFFLFENTNIHLWNGINIKYRGSRLMWSDYMIKVTKSYFAPFLNNQFINAANSDFCYLLFKFKYLGTIEFQSWYLKDCSPLLNQKLSRYTWSIILPCFVDICGKLFFLHFSFFLK